MGNADGLLRCVIYGHIYALALLIGKPDTLTAVTFIRFISSGQHESGAFFVCFPSVFEENRQRQRQCVDLIIDLKRKAFPVIGKGRQTEGTASETVHPAPAYSGVTGPHLCEEGM